jgi:hypothetical protein
VLARRELLTLLHHFFPAPRRRPTFVRLPYPSFSQDAEGARQTFTLVIFSWGHSEPPEVTTSQAQNNVFL